MMNSVHLHNSERKYSEEEGPNKNGKGLHATRGPQVAHLCFVEVLNLSVEFMSKG